MKTETRERIQFYTQKLPGMREKVVATAVMFLIALAMAAVATYAWMTLSAAPEVSGIDTSVVANGSLEIALASESGAEPTDSAVGDSTDAGKSITAANVTWGNLINLSDSSYGLSDLTLRPAALNGTTGLLRTPIFGVEYGADGRVSETLSGDSFSFVYYSAADGKFLVDTGNNHLGVRGIATVQYENLAGASTMATLVKKMNVAKTKAQTSYASITDQSQEPGATYISSLQGLLQVYAQNAIDDYDTNALNVAEYVPTLYAMVKTLNDKVILSEGECYVQLANMLHLLKVSNSDGDAGLTLETMISGYKAETLPSYMLTNLTEFEEFIKIYEDVQPMLETGTSGDFSDLTTAKRNGSLAYWAYRAEGGAPVYWSDIQDIIVKLCDIDSVTIDGYELDQIQDENVALQLVAKSGAHLVFIRDGLLYDIEKSIDEHMSPEISVTADPSNKIPQITATITLNAILKTSASAPFGLATDIGNVESLNTGTYRGDTATAQDTYALAMDFWLRTNAGTEASTVDTVVGTGDSTVTTTAEKAYLTLEGAARTQKVTNPVKTRDANGVQVDSYEATYTVDEEQVTLEPLYKSGDTYYYLDDNGAAQNAATYIAAAGGTNVTYMQQMETTTVVIGYDSVNRVWTDSQMAVYSTGEGTSTTQGGGSCYVFYADTPTDQSRFLELLDAMYIAFVDGSGNRIGRAKLDTASYYAENGKVTVPVVLDKGTAIDLGKDDNGKEVYGLMALNKNEATRVTAIVYLDGTRVTNEMVLSGGDIQGNLNIQFGSYNASLQTTVTGSSTTTTYIHTSDLSALEDKDLMKETIVATASVTEDSFTFDPDNAATTTLNVAITGTEPETVSARFIRVISTTQGVQQESCTLTAGAEEGSWSGNITFAKPGNYILRSVWLDGVEYDLEQPVEVTVEGSSLNYVACGAGLSATILTAESSYSTDVTVGFTTSAVVPSKVTGLFMDESGHTVTVPFHLVNSKWTGTATFSVSGTYTMQYVEVDGEVYEVSASYRPTLEIKLGLRVGVSITASSATLTALQAIDEGAIPTNFSIVEDDNNPITLNVTAKIYDNSGEEITGLTGVKLYYGLNGSALPESGLDANLTWTKSSGAYTGDFAVSHAGVYNFTKLTVLIGGATSTITGTTSAPSVTAKSTVPVAYAANDTDERQFAPNVDAAMTISLSNSASAGSVVATVQNGTYGSGTSEEVEGVIGGTEGSNTAWSFTLPEDGAHEQEGQWTMTKVTVDGTEIDLSAKGITTKVVNNAYVTLGGTDATGSNALTGSFMESQTLSGVTVTVEDYEGEAIDELTAVNLSYKLDAASVTLDAYGYTADSDVLSAVVVSANVAGSGTTYTASATGFTYAGEYDASVTLGLGSSNYDSTSAEGSEVVVLKDGNNTCQVKWSSQPDVKWIAVSASSSFSSTTASYVNMNSDKCDGTNRFHYRLWSDYTYSKDFSSLTASDSNLGCKTTTKACECKKNPEVCNTLGCNTSSLRTGSTSAYITDPGYWLLAGVPYSSGYKPRYAWTALGFENFTSATLTFTCSNSGATGYSITYTSANTNTAMKIGPEKSYSSTCNSPGYAYANTIDVTTNGVTLTVNLKHPIYLKSVN